MADSGAEARWATSVVGGPTSPRGAGVEARGSARKSLAAVGWLEGVGRRRSDRTDRTTVASGVRAGVGGAPTWAGRHRAEAAPTRVGRLKVEHGLKQHLSQEDEAQGGGAGHCVAVAAEPKKFSHGVRHGEGVKA
jgi:hypothetical protein